MRCGRYSRRCKVDGIARRTRHTYAAGLGSVPWLCFTVKLQRTNSSVVLALRRFVRLRRRLRALVVRLLSLTFATRVAWQRPAWGRPWALCGRCMQQLPKAFMRTCWRRDRCCRVVGYRRGSASRTRFRTRLLRTACREPCCGRGRWTRLSSVPTVSRPTVTLPTRLGRIRWPLWQHITRSPCLPLHHCLRSTWRVRRALTLSSRSGRRRRCVAIRTASGHRPTRLPGIPLLMLPRLI
mmetsp:Transcript_14523/g.45649  ORF Transcript_14523/g.45649 Transcript_14523/m.45649 type:complete len:238 (+) Transcript_14523:359-1072(+)